ncbi:NAD(P)H dehydrogenase (quinone) [Mucilaginibacter sp. OK268]|uniref:NAD(P)H-dependent oxidoreductase n=1 Tax=Mucilaginibacter sp. OK268 TaxID=1881048 RepID=UPI0008906AAC|nr:NAD(P)H-dependent oxidoreductase [Mucilaginibacter sp. OK268]SDP21550.1 NAD(P)H dehydrogenase (quinone) [Mucilaginibacter sp. OK268]
MKILIIYAHPEPRSMNGAMFTEAIDTLINAGHEVKVSDLYAMQFNPVSDRTNFTTINDPIFFKQQLEEEYASQANGFVTFIEEEQQKVEWCDLMIWQFPLWWFSVPAILKGWVDRVFAMGRFYGNGRIYENGVFCDKKALLSITTGGPEANYIKDRYGDLSVILHPLQRGILEFTGFSVLRPQVIYGTERQSPESLSLEVETWKTRLSNIFEEVPIVMGNY